MEIVKETIDELGDEAWDDIIRLVTYDVRSKAFYDSSDKLAAIDTDVCDGVSNILDDFI